MKAIFIFDIKGYFKRWGFWLMLLLILSLGLFVGQNARFSLSKDIFDNSPYQVGFITMLISLVTLFFSTLLTAQLLFKEADARIGALIFSTSLSKLRFLAGRYLALLSMSVLLIVVLLISFYIGHGIATSSTIQTGFVLGWYLRPIIFFGLINTFFVTAVLSFVAWISRNKLLVYVIGLLLYIVYMVSLIYSGSPMMAQSLPQSGQSQLIAAIADPFGFSAFFHQTAHWTVAQRNSEVVSLTGIFLLNRLGVVLLSMGLLMLGAKQFCLDATGMGKGKPKAIMDGVISRSAYKATATFYHTKAQLQALCSFVKMDLAWILKSIPFVLTAMGMLFMVGMEMYAEIEKGIRIPQKYASSGLMVSTIIQNFHGLGMIALVYYAHETFWRSRNANFHLIEHSAANTRTSLLAKCVSLIIITVLFSALIIVEGIVFQFTYRYPAIEWSVYAYVLLFNTFPLILLCVIMLLIQKWIYQKYIGLGVTAVFAILMATSLGKKLVLHPLLKFLQPLTADYSDMNGFGTYTAAYAEKLLFGAMVAGVLLIVSNRSKRKLRRWTYLAPIALMMVIACMPGTDLVKKYRPKNKTVELQAQVDYELAYRKYQHLCQPTITDVITTVELEPEQSAYHIRGRYVMRNKSADTITSILVNFDDDMQIGKAAYRNNSETVAITKHQQIINLHKPLVPSDTASLDFDISYQWYAVNGHQSFNAIVSNGTFIRISRYYPQLGYNAGREVQDKKVRKQLHLGDATAVKLFDAPKVANNDFINLDMTISTAPGQTAIGVGELTNKWQDKGRCYFRYRTGSPVPFRFAVSSARYAVRREVYKGRFFEIYYHPSHYENVEHLMKNARLTMDYCETNFGPYPFPAIRFAEISSFTKGFAATAYPATVYMAEDMIFHANIKADKQQDVVNELAGHELSHLWWGNSQIDPDDREGSPLLTETLAMYTEMMLLEKMYGKQKMLDRLRMHLGIYLDEKGFTEEHPLIKMYGEDTHLSYSKGAVVMYQLSELIGEDKVNLALRNFLAKNKYPNAKPISSDLLNEFYKVAEKKYHQQIKDMFTGIDSYPVKI